MSANKSKSKKQEVHNLVDHLFRTQYGKMVSILTTIFGFPNLEIAEDIVQDTLLEAFRRWSYSSIPKSPEAWLMQVAKNKALNFLKKERNKAKAYQNNFLYKEAYRDIQLYFQEEEIEDSLLRMVFACCHPNIAKEDQIAIILKTLCGFGNKEIARALLLNEESINKRIYRAKQKIKKQRIQFIIPNGQALISRLDMVCTSLYLLFNEGYKSSSANELIRKDLCLEAIRLCKLLCQHFKEEPKVFALMAIMYFHAARFDSRVDHNGAMILLPEQDRSIWQKDLIQAGFYHLSKAATGSQLSAYHLEASIAAQHCQASSFEQTNWKFIHVLYKKLFEIKPNPIIKLNLAIVSSRIHGVQQAIQQLEQLKKEKKLHSNHLLFAALGEFQKRMGQNQEALKNFNTALALTQSEIEKQFLIKKIESIKVVHK